jgi:uncharacterized phage protein gp47/JayE
MPFQRPTLTELSKQARADIAQASGDYAILRSSPLGILAKAVTGLVQGLYGYLDWLARQAVPATATGEFLRAWAALVGIFPKDGGTASGTASFSGVPGSVLPDGTQLARSADGLAYVTTAIGTIDGSGLVTVPVTAAAAGATGNLVAGAQVVITSAVIGINATGNVAAPFTGGADAELEEDFRDRMLARYQAPPQGGSVEDYITWAKEVVGVTRAWVTPNGAGAGTVVVYTMLDDAQAGAGGFPQGSDGVASAETRGVPATGDQLLVANHIYPLRPATALVYAVAPLAYPIPYIIADLAEDNAENRVAIAAALTGMMRRTASPGGTIYPSDSNGAIKGVPGVTRFTLIYPTAPLTAPAGQLPILASITWD